MLLLVFLSGEVAPLSALETPACEHAHSTEAGCVPVYPTKVVVTPGHEHSTDCYTYNTETEQNELTCAIEESPGMTTEVLDTEAEPIGWDCAHKDCALGEPCQAQDETIGVQPLTITGPDGDALTLKVSDSASGFVDVDDRGNAITWPLTTLTKQIQITARFSGVGTDKTRTVTVNIPRGLKIVEYSATTGTAAISGVSKIAFSEENEPKVASSVLTAADGSAWASQRITGYTGSGTATEAAVRVYDGKIVYSFNNNCDEIKLTLTLSLDQSLMPHNATTATLNNITVDMASGTQTLQETLAVTVSELVVSSLRDASNAYGTRVIAGTEDPLDPDKGTVAEFETGLSSWIHIASTGSQNHLAEKATFVFSYPAGVTFTGFSEIFTGTSKTAVDAGFTSGTYANGHLIVTLDTAARTVTFTYTNILLRHINNNAIVCCWTAEIDNGTIKWGDKLIFSTAFAEESGLSAGIQKTHGGTLSGPTITVRKPDVTIALTAQNRTRRDLNAYANGAYPYDYMLGQFYVRNTGSSVAGNLLYAFTFSPNLQVRGVSLPGYSGNNYSKITAETNLGRTIVLNGPFSVTNTSQSDRGLTIDSVKLGLAPGEYLVSLQAWQDSLNALNYTSSYTHSHTSYFGRFAAGLEGDAMLTIYDASDPENPVQLATVTDHTKIGWTNFGAGSVTLTATPVNTGDGTGAGSFYPNAAIKFSAVYSSAASVRTQNDGVDPVIYISLPEGIALDTGSVMGKSLSGNHGGSEFPLQLLRSETRTINGTLWTVYAFSSANTLDMVAKSNHGFSTALDPSGYNSITLTFTANVSSTCPTYAELKATDIVLWDFGQTAESATAGTNYTLADANNIAGKGASYNLVGATQATPLNIVQKPGLKVSIGIRTYEDVLGGNTNPFYTYNGTAASVAPVTVDAPAEIWLKYENTDTSSYYAGSEIYLPIPKKDQAYSAYFNNAEISDPVNNTDTKTLKWSGYLTGPVSLPGFTTWYTTDTTYQTRPVPADNSWTPDYNYTWTQSPANYADVTMIKFVANVNIPAGGTGETTFTIGVDSDARLGDVNYWRSYQKGWRSAAGDGTWLYGSVVAAEPSLSGIEGMLFNDIDVDGVKAAAGEIFDNTAKNITAVLTGTTISPLNLTMLPDGSFKTLNANGTQYFLKTGTYTVTLYNGTSGAYGFTPTTSTTASDETGWRMDVLQASIAANHATATYTFTVDSTMRTDMTLYLGVGLRASPVVTYVPGTGASFTTSTESIIYGRSPANNPVISGANVMANYDPDSVRWTLDKTVTLSGGGTIPAGTPITTTELRQVMVTENLTATANLTGTVYTITYNLDGATANPSPMPTSYTVGALPVSIGQPAKDGGYLFAGWTVAYAITGFSDIDAPTTTYTTVPAGTWGNITLTAHWIQTFALNYDLNVAAGDPHQPTRNGGVDMETVAAGATITAQVGYIANTTTGIPARPGYSFAGWYHEPTGATAVTLTDAMPNDQSKTLYAKWTPVGYTITYYDYNDVDITSSLSSNPASYDVGDLPLTVSQKPSRQDYVFSGWTAEYYSGTDWVAFAMLKADPGDDTADILPAGVYGNLRLKANYTQTIHAYTLDFVLNGTAEFPTTPESIASVEVDAGAKISEAPGYSSPTRLGYRFDGWYLDEGLTQQVNSETLMPAQNQTIYAKWTRVYTVTFIGNGGMIAPGNETRTVVPPDTTLGSAMPPNPTRGGYWIFTGWNTAQNGSGTAFTASTLVADDITVYAQWRYQEYDWSYDPPLVSPPLISPPQTGDAAVPASLFLLLGGVLLGGVLLGMGSTPRLGSKRVRTARNKERHMAHSDNQ